MLKQSGISCTVAQKRHGYKHIHIFFIFIFISFFVHVVLKKKKKKTSIISAFYLAITLFFTVKTLKSKQLLFWDITQHTTSRFKDLPPTGALQRQPLFERAFLLVAKQSNTVNFPALEKGLSLVPSQDSISCLELVTVRRGKTEENLAKRCPTVRSHSAAEPEEAVNQWVRSNATAFVTLPFKTI